MLHIRVKCNYFFLLTLACFFALLLFFSSTTHPSMVFLCTTTFIQTVSMHVESVLHLNIETMKNFQKMVFSDMTVQIIAIITLLLLFLGTSQSDIFNF